MGQLGMRGEFEGFYFLAIAKFNPLKTLRHLRRYVCEQLGDGTRCLVILVLRGYYFF
jgi:hypothetical protein